MNGFVIVIPSLEPDYKLIQLLQSIRQTQRTIPIYIINDGSSAEYDEVFQECLNYQVTLLKHEVNLGKGAALKTAMRHILNERSEIEFMVTIDSDGQHTVSDMLACIQAAKQNSQALILGTRTFLRGVPMKSKFGNVLTRNVLNLATGINIEDSQTGLRVIPRYFMPALLRVKGERFEFETQMLLATKVHKIPIVMQAIETIYIEDNSSSHFRVFSDSIKIYSVFVKYFLSSVLSFLLDILAYSLLIRWLVGVNLGTISIASFVARSISSSFNYYINNKHVFSSQSTSSLMKYFSLVIIQIGASSGLVYLITQFLRVSDTVWVKVSADSALFLASFFIQKYFIFKE